jgi:hypothetical protein
VRALRFLPQAIAELSRWASCDPINGDTLTLTASSREALPEILGYLVQSGCAPFEFTPQRISLEDLFMEIVGPDRGL